jgi:hypothetical protein
MSFATTINYIKGEIMSNKNEAINAVNRAIGFIRATACHDVSNTFVKELNSALDLVNSTGIHEEYKAAWLNIVNTLHCIDPNWQENTLGESEWEKAAAFISHMNQLLRRQSDDIQRYQQEDYIHFSRKYFDEGVSYGYLTEWVAPFKKRVISREVIQEATTQIKDELAAAENKPPTWPKDTVHATAILNEEAGKLTQAAIDYHYHNGSLEKVRSYAARVGAMAIRVLINLPYAERPAASEKKVTGAAR